MRRMAVCIRVGRLLLGAALALSATLVSAQTTYPDRPLKLVVPYPPGALTEYNRPVAGRAFARGGPVIYEGTFRRR